GHARFQGRIENNLGSLFSSIGRFSEAHEHLDRARSLFVKVRDKGAVAQVDETVARTLLAEGRNAEAATLMRNCVRAFEDGDERSALAEALTTYGTVMARLERNEEAVVAFNRAMSVADQAGDSYSRGLAALTLIEELSKVLPSCDLRNYFWKAEAGLPASQ